jgi:hypothetical protein
MIVSPHLEDVDLTLRWSSSRPDAFAGIIIQADDGQVRLFSSSHSHGIS